MQGHARDDEVEIGMTARLACVHHLIADMSGSACGEIPPAFGDHGWRNVGQHEASLRVTPHQMAAQETRAAAKLEHARAVKLR
jgi:hypothetical protein